MSVSYPNLKNHKNKLGDRSEFLFTDAADLPGITSKALVQPDGYWNGAIVRARNRNWMYSTSRVSSSQVGRLLITPHFSTEAKFGFYLEGRLSELDAPGEFYYDVQSRKLYMVPLSAAVGEALVKQSLAGSPTSPQLSLIFDDAGTAISIEVGAGAINLQGLRVQHWYNGVSCGGAEASDLHLKNMEFLDIYFDGLVCWGASKFDISNNIFARLGLTWSSDQLMPLLE